MSGRRAKVIRREVYGDYSIRARKYYRHEKSTTIFCDERRRAYQKAKKEV